MSDQYDTTWPPINQAARDTWSNAEEATEFGAVAVAVALTRAALGYVVKMRARSHTGIDYWLAPDSDPDSPENYARLEVSGIRHGTSSSVAHRLKAKKVQMNRFVSDRPGFAIVVEFGMPQARVAKS